MQKSEHEIRDRDEIENILRQATVLHLGLVDSHGPYVVPMNFGYAEGKLFVHSAPTGRKIDAMRAQPRVFFETFLDHDVIRHEKACGFSSTYRCAMGTGIVRFLDGPAERASALDVLMEKFADAHTSRREGGGFAYDPKVIERTCVLEIAIETLSGKQAEPWVPQELDR